MDARVVPLSSETGVIDVWPPVAEQIEARKIITSFELDFISLSVQRRRERDGAVDRSGW